MPLSAVAPAEFAHDIWFRLRISILSGLSREEQRQRQVDQTTSNMHLSDFESDSGILKLKRHYIDGEMPIRHILDWCAEFARSLQRLETQYYWCAEFARSLQRLETQYFQTPKDAHQFAQLTLCTVAKTGVNSYATST